jgi:hypothetical protein
MTQQNGAGGGWPQNPGQPGHPGQVPGPHGYGVPAQQPSGMPAPQQPYGAPAQQPPYGVPAQQQPYGVPAQQQPYGVPAQQPYGAPAQGTPQAYGVPPQAQPMPPGAAPQGLGFDLNPDERVLWAVKRSYTGEKVSYWILGVLFAVILIGLWFIYMAVTIEAKSPRALVMTNRRLVVLEGSGAVSSYWLQEYVDLNPKRQQAQTGGRGGLVGALVAAAVTAGLNALANRNEKITPAYWARTIAIVFKHQDGRDIPVTVKPNEATVVGPMLARCILMKEADSLPPYDASSLQVQAAVASASTPGYWIGGGVLMFFSAVIGYTGVNRLAWGGWAFGLIFTVFGLGMLTGAFALFYAASKTSWKLAESQGKKPNKLMPIAIPGGIAAFLTLLIVGSGISTAFRAYRYRSSYSEYSYTSPTSKPTATAAPTSTLPTTGGPLSPGAIEGAFLAQGYKSSGSRGADKSTSGCATTYTWSMSHATNGSLWARLFDGPTPSTTDAKSWSATQTHAASVELTGTGANFSQSMLLSSALVSKAPTSGKAVVAVLAANGWKLSSSMMADASYAFGQRTYLAFAKKGAVNATIYVVDYSPAAAGKEDVALQVTGMRVLIVSAGKSSASQELLRKIGP